MFDIGFWEVLIIGVVGLVVIGPERLPAVARTLGSWVGKMRGFVASTRADLEKEINSTELRQILDDKQGEINELRDILNDTRASIENSDQYVMNAIDDEPVEDKAPNTPVTDNRSDVSSGTNKDSSPNNNNEKKEQHGNA
ncbi:MAG: Sec-independent protein translocase protein TatB [Gammaproteobacteria bacterium]|nr:Sec-independent protein translocase protein TatB [Gammaproteobacteria bacterium]